MTGTELPDELREVQERWSAASREEQDRLYAHELGPRFVPVFAAKRLAGSPDGLAGPPDQGPRGLASVLGFSWQPLALMAAWVRPSRMLVLGTADSLALRVGDEGPLSLVARVSGVPRDHIEHVLVSDDGEIDIYRAVRSFVQRHGFAHDHVFVDPTGGKKSMSAAAALAGFLLGARLVYVDCIQYHPVRRIPIAGTEFPRLLANPLTELGDLELDRIRDAFRAGRFVDARVRADDLAARLYEPRLAETYALLAEGYGAWESFRFAAAIAPLERACDAMNRYRRHAGWEWSAAVAERIEHQLPILRRLAGVSEHPTTLEDGMPLVLNHLAAARRALSRDALSSAVMLTYATIERYLDLCLWADHGLDDERPDYSRLSSKLDLERFHLAGRALHAKAYEPRDPAGPLMFSLAAQLTAALHPERLTPADLGLLKGLSVARNRTEMEHGLVPRPPSRDDARRFLDGATVIVGRASGGSGELSVALEALRFPSW